ncbi:MAG: hypothetical protein ACT4TC_07260, partial [Myxococcaceae bacterium]
MNGPVGSQTPASTGTGTDNTPTTVDPVTGNPIGTPAGGGGDGSGGGTNPLASLPMEEQIFAG